MKKIVLLVPIFLLLTSTAQAKVTFNPITITSPDDWENVIFSGHSDWPVDFEYLTGITNANGSITPCPDVWEYPAYTSSWGDFFYQIQNKLLAPWDYWCIMSATEYPLVNTGSVTTKYTWKVKPAFESLFDPAPATVEVNKNIRLILRTSDPVQPLPNTPKSQQIELYDTYGQKIEITDDYNPIINIAYFSTPSDPRVVYDLKFPSTYTGTISIQPHPTNIVRQDGSTVLSPTPYVQFDLVDQPVVLDGSGNVLTWATKELNAVPLLEQYLTGAMIDSKITSGSPQTFWGVLLDIRSILIYFMIALWVFAFLAFFRSLFKR